MTDHRKKQMKHDSQVQDTILDTIITKIKGEHARQKSLWGTVFDDKNTLDNWIAFITAYCGKAFSADSPKKARHRLLQVATLAIAACEAYDRNDGFPPSHYCQKG